MEAFLLIYFQYFEKSLGYSYQVREWNLNWKNYVYQEN